MKNNKLYSKISGQIHLDDFPNPEKNGTEEALMLQKEDCKDEVETMK